MKKVLIIGSGLSGLSCALELAQKGISSTLVSPYPSERAQSVMAAGGINASLGEGDWYVIIRSATPHKKQINQ